MSFVRRNRPFEFSFEMRGNVLNGRSVFSVTNGTLTVSCNSFTDTQTGAVSDFTIQPIKRNSIFGDGDAKRFNVGRDAQTWTELDEGDYYLRITARDHYPSILSGSGRVS